MTKDLRKRIKYPVRYSSMGQYIYDADDKMIADVRGWGWIQKLPQPEEVQDSMGQFIADAINEKLAPQTNQQALELWEGMFGQATTAKGGGYTVEYKTFIERIVLFANGQKRKGFDQNVSEQISEMQIVDIAKLLGAIIYKTVMKDTGAKDAEFKLKGFSVDGEMLGTLKISAQLEPSKRGQDGL